MPNFNVPGQTGGNPFTTTTGIFGGIVGIVVWLAVLVFMLYVWARIFRKAGYSGLLTLLLLVPLVNIVLIIWFGFAHWPVEHEAMVARGTPPPGYYEQGGQQQVPPPTTSQQQAPPSERGGGYQPPPGAPTPQH